MPTNYKGGLDGSGTADGGLKFMDRRLVRDVDVVMFRLIPRPQSPRRPVIKFSYHLFRSVLPEATAARRSGKSCYRLRSDGLQYPPSVCGKSPTFLRANDIMDGEYIGSTLIPFWGDACT